MQKKELIKKNFFIFIEYCIINYVLKLKKKNL